MEVKASSRQELAFFKFFFFFVPVFKEDVLQRGDVSGAEQSGVMFDRFYIDKDYRSDYRTHSRHCLCILLLSKL